MRQLLIATHNPGKVKEIRRLLADTGWDPVPLADEAPTYDETGDTFAANARGKACFYSALTGLPALADDSGLEIDALDGEPGVYSARYIDPGITQAERNLRVLEKLAEVPAPERGARFVCHLTLAAGDRIVHEARGTCEGRIATEVRGVQGFGYDPIFLVPELGRTFAEVDADTKAGRSHRGRAVRAMVEFLSKWSSDDLTPGVS